MALANRTCFPGQLTGQNGFLGGKPNTCLQRNLSSCQTGRAQPSGGTLVPQMNKSLRERVLRIPPASIGPELYIKRQRKHLSQARASHKMGVLGCPKDNFQILQFYQSKKGPQEHPASQVQGCLNQVYLLSEESNNLTLPPGSCHLPTHCPSTAASQLRSSGIGR